MKPSGERKFIFREKVAELFELPKDILINTPKLTIVGDNELLVENFRGIIEFDTKIIRINTNSGMLKVVGMQLGIKEITADELMINGKILSLEFA